MVLDINKFTDTIPEPNEVFKCMGRLTAYYDMGTLSEVLERPYVSQPYRVTQDRVKEILTQCSRDRHWWGVFRNGHEVLNRLKGEGWQEGVDEIEQKLRALQLPTARSVRRKRVFRGQGDVVDMQRVYNGQLDRAWQTTQRFRSTNAGSNNVIIAMHTTTTCNTDADDVFWRTAVAVSLGQTLAASGRNVQLDMIEANGNNAFQPPYPYEAWMMKMTLKEFEQPLDMSHIALCSSVGFYRSVRFAAQFTVLPQQPGSGLGACMFVTAEDLPASYARDRVRVVFIPAKILSRRDAEQFLDHVHSSLLEAA